jgi:glycosyltransferase involved in cell wall biosynthesis
MQVNYIGNSEAMGYHEGGLATDAMRALHVFPVFSPGSSNAQESYARHLTEGLRGLGIKVEVLYGNKASLALLGGAWSALARCDVLLAGFPPTPMISAAIRLAKTRRKPVVVLPSLDGEFSADTGALGRMIASAAATLVVTEHFARGLSRLCPKCKIVDVGTGVDPEVFGDSAISGARFRAKYELGDRPFLFTPGGKGVDLAIDAMFYFVPGSSLLTVGDEHKGNKLPSDRVRFLGPLSDADRRDAYDACDVFVFPSPEEKWPSALLEAWARAKPVIGNPSSFAVSSLIDDAVDGFLCDNSRTISKRVALLLENPALGRKMGEAGRRKLLAHHTWEHVAKRVRDVYESCGATCAIPKEK